METRLVSEAEAYALIRQYHYSKVMPRLTKFCLGAFEGNKLVGVCTLGWGVRPLHTIKIMFPSLGVSDYLEIGKLCLADSMPKNSESQFLSQVVANVRRHAPGVSILFSWADGIIGKPGYVYQASNFYYGGFIWTEMYLSPEGNRVHPRTMQGLSAGERVGKFKSRAYEVTTSMGYTKYFGLQFRYVYPLCGKKPWVALQAESPFSWERGHYPKDDSCLWKRLVQKGVRQECPKPPFMATNYVLAQNTGQLGLGL